MNNYEEFLINFALFLYFCTVQTPEATGFSLIIVQSAPPILKKKSNQQLTLVLRQLCVEFHHL